MVLILGYLFGILSVFPAYYLVVKQRDQLDKEILELCKKLDEKDLALHQMLNGKD